MDFLINFDKERFATFTHRQAEFTAFVGDTRCSPCEGVELAGFIRRLRFGIRTLIGKEERLAPQ